jgi:adenosylcobyric acid synthase
MRKSAAAVMIQGTGSHVGKSLIVAGLCRALARRGLSVAPFKPQNMSNNAAVTADGGEIGRAQALQARAANIPASVHMNPVLLKPESETGSQVILRGQRVATMQAAEYSLRKVEFLPRVLESFRIVAAVADIVIVEGAGSPAETNLRSGDIANMGFAEAADIPVVIVGDIDRGGVIASLVGTHAVLAPEDRARIRGFIVNKLRGDAGLFIAGVRRIEMDTGWPSLGVLPWFEEAHQLPAEDSLGLPSQEGNAVEPVVVAVPMLPRIANFDDLDPLRAEPGVSVVMVAPAEPFPADASLILIPGSKSTIADLAFLKAQGWDIDIKAHVRRGGRVLGICGGYQMLGRTIVDPEGIEGSPGMVGGLGLLDVETVLTSDKAIRPVRGEHAESGTPVSGYEIHLGRTDGPDRRLPFVRLGDANEGAQSVDRQVAGTYVHGIFASDKFRGAFLAELGLAPSTLRYDTLIDATLDSLADHLERHLDVDALLEIARHRASAAAPRTTSRNKKAPAPT